MEWFGTNQKDFESGAVTDIRVYITRAARRKAERLVNNPDEMLERCVWRFIWEKNRTDEIKGEHCEFTMLATDITRLVRDLDRIDKEAKS